MEITFKYNIGDYVWYVEGVEPPRIVQIEIEERGYAESSYPLIKGIYYRLNYGDDKLLIFEGDNQIFSHKKDAIEEIKKQFAEKLESL